MSKITFPSTKTNRLRVPWDASCPPPSLYEPIDCDFTDELEFVAVKKIEIKIKYWNHKKLKTESIGLIKDIQTANQEEYLILSNGEHIRLDHIIELQLIDTE